MNDDVKTEAWNLLPRSPDCQDLKLSFPSCLAFTRMGAPRIFISHGIADEQIAIARSARVHTALLRETGYEVSLIEYNGGHAYQPSVAALAVDFFLVQSLEEP